MRRLSDRRRGKKANPQKRIDLAGPRPMLDRSGDAASFTLLAPVNGTRRWPTRDLAGYPPKCRTHTAKNKSWKVMVGGEGQKSSIRRSEPCCPLDPDLNRRRCVFHLDNPVRRSPTTKPLAHQNRRGTTGISVFIYPQRPNLNQVTRISLQRLLRPSNERCQCPSLHHIHTYRSAALLVGGSPQRSNMIVNSASPTSR